MGATVEANFQWSLRVNRQTTLREKVGAVLRRLAWRIDGRLTLAIAIESTPPLGLEQQIECVRFGLGQLQFAVADTVRTAAEERVLEALMKGKMKHGTPT